MLLATIGDRDHGVENTDHVGEDVDEVGEPAVDDGEAGDQIEVDHQVGETAPGPSPGLRSSLHSCREGWEGKGAVPNTVKLCRLFPLVR